MERIWLKSYPPGVPAEIDPGQYESVVALLEGGYDVRRTGEGTVNVLRALAGAPPGGQTLPGA